MEGECPGRVAAAALLALFIPLAIAATGMDAPAASAQPTPTGGAQVTESDQQLLVKVRQAGLWEIPTGQQAQQRATSQVVKDVSAHLVADHLKLDDQVRAVAAQLGVALPSQATDEQQGWMTELSGKSGPDYDQAFVNRLRAAHGKVFTFIAQVRADTRNDVIRPFAQHVGGVVKKHLTLLESTGLVDFDALPEPELPAPASSTATADLALGPATSIPPDSPPGTPVALAAQSRTSDESGIGVGLVIVICVAEVGLTVGLLRLFQSR